MSATVEISDEVAAQVRELVESGAYPDSDSAVREAIRLLREERQRQRLREMIAEADEEIARGESDLWSDELSQRLVREAQEMYRSGAQCQSPMSSLDLRIRISRRAQADIKRFYVYTAHQWDVDQSNRYQQQIGDAFRELARHPSIGVERPDIATGIRSWVTGSHVVLYCVRADELVNTGVVHSRQDPGTFKV